MHVRKALTLGAAVLAAGLLSLNPTSQAANPTGGNIASVWVNNVGTTATPAINGILGHTNSRVAYSSGTGTYACNAATVAGTVNRGPVSAAPEMSLSLPTFTCRTPWMIDATFTYGCTVTPKFTDANVHSGTVDTGTGSKFSRVDGATAFSDCLPFSAGGFCTASIVTSTPPPVYSVATYFDEAITTVNSVDYQRLIFSGTIAQFYNQSPGCLGLLTSLQLKDFVFYVQVTGGTTTGIDFRP